MSHIDNKDVHLGYHAKYTPKKGKNTNKQKTKRVRNILGNPDKKHKRQNMGTIKIRTKLDGSHKW